MSDFKQAQLMLRMARKDFKALKGMMDIEIFEEEIFGFHAQQAIEKTLKGWIAFLGYEYPLTHDISTLLEFLEVNGLDVGRYRNLVEYNTFAVRFRYEAFDASEEPLNRKETLREVEELIRHIEKLIASK
jgi:HEPN domain-containing protein